MNKHPADTRLHESLGTTPTVYIHSLIAYTFICKKGKTSPMRKRGAGSAGKGGVVLQDTSDSDLSIIVILVLIYLASLLLETFAA